MPANLTGSQVKDTFNQLLHVDGGPAASEKAVYSGTGVATALKVGTGSISVDNIRVDGNTISSLNPNGDINLTPNGTGSVVIPTLSSSALSTVGAAAHLDLSGVGITADGTNADINITLTPKGTGSVAIPKVDITSGNVVADSISTRNAATHLDFSGAGVVADGTDANINITLTPKGAGSVVIPKVDIAAGSVAFATLAGRAFASFSDITDQTGSTTVATPVKFGTVEVVGAGITMVTDGANLTRLTFAAAGTYAVMPNLQFINSDSADHDVTVWFALNGVNMARSATKITVPKTADGGSAFFQIVFYATVTAGQYVQVLWLPENTAVTLDHTAAVTGPPAVPAIPSAIISAERIA